MSYKNPEIIITEFDAADMIIASDVVREEYDAYISYSSFIAEKSNSAYMEQ